MVFKTVGVKEDVKQIIDEIKDYEKKRKRIIDGIKKCLKDAFVFEVFWSEEYGVVACFSDLIISLRDECIYKGFSYNTITDLSEGEMFEILYGKKFKGNEYHIRDVKNTLKSLLR